MARREDFLTAIAADPHNDDLRKVYADWLEEHGGPEDREEAIRQRRWPEVRAESRAWLEDFATVVDMPYDDLIAAAQEYADRGFGVTLPFDTPDRCFSDAEELWEHYEIVTGRKLARERRGNFFRCAC